MPLITVKGAKRAGKAANVAPRRRGIALTEDDADLLVAMARMKEAPRAISLESLLKKHGSKRVVR